MVSEKGPKIYRHKHIKHSLPPEKKANIDQKKKFISLTKLFLPLLPIYSRRYWKSRHWFLQSVGPFRELKSETNIKQTKSLNKGFLYKYRVRA